MSTNTRLPEITPAKGRRSTFNKQNTKVADQRVSVCNVCNRGIFPHHEYSWTNRGLVHDWCVDEIT